MAKIELSEEILSLVKKTEFEVVSIETTNTENNTILTLELPDEIYQQGSQVTTEGKPISTSSKFVTIIGDDITLFTKDFKNKKYSGTMKLDVSKPKGRMNGDKYEITTPIRLQLCSVSLKDFGQGNTRKRTDGANEALNALFRTPEEVKAALARAQTAAVKSGTKQLEVVGGVVK